jgi:hypothetical protein
MKVVWIKYSKGDSRTALGRYTMRVLDDVEEKWIRVEFYKHDVECKTRDAADGVQCCPGKTRMPDQAKQPFDSGAKLIARRNLREACSDVWDASYDSLEKIYRSPNLCALVLLILKAERFVPTDTPIFYAAPKSGHDECMRLVKAGWCHTGTRTDGVAWFWPAIAPSVSVKTLLLMNAAHAEYAIKIGYEIGVTPTIRPILGAPDESVGTNSLGRLWRRYK